MDTDKELNNIKIKENDIWDLDEALLTILLKDNSSGENLIWATDTYAWRGIGYAPQDHITLSAITSPYGNVIKPRIEKSQNEQRQRIKNKAEVFTPSWVCNRQNNLVDNAWFGKNNVFNKETIKGWKTNKEKIGFPNVEGKTWQDYVKANRLEIACGEAPYLTSRYDTVSGEFIELSNRIGLLDRKLRVIGENTNDESEWIQWVLVAYKSIYGFDFQGDNVLIARENLLFTFIDAYIAKFRVLPNKGYLKQIAKILAWNIWQMDGLKYVIPYSCKPKTNLQISLFDAETHDEECLGCIKKDNTKHIGIYCKIMNWSRQHAETFISQVERKSK